MDNQNSQDDQNSQPPQPDSPYPSITAPPTDNSTPVPSTPNPVPMNYSPINPNTTPLPTEQNQQPVGQFSQTFATQQPMPVQNTYNAIAPKKRGLTWLWVTLAIVAILAVATAVTALVSINNANSVADTYSSSLKTYLSDVADAVSGSSSSPEEIIKEIENIKKPVLESVFLGNLSTKYKAAQTIAQKTDSIISQTSNEAELYVGLYNFYTSFSKDSEILYTELYSFYSRGNSLDTAKSILSNLSNTCNKMVESADEAKLPEKSQTHLSEVLSATKSMCTNINDFETSLMSNDRDSFMAAGAKIETTTEEFFSSYEALKKDYEEIASNIKELAKPAQELADKL